MQTDSSSLDTLKNSLLSAVDANYNVTDADKVLNIISQLETMEITRDQLHSTRLGREINNIRLKIDARKKSVQQTGVYPESIIQIAHRAKKLLKSWQGLLNTSQSDPAPPPSAPPPPPPAPQSPPVTVNGDSHDSTSPNSTESSKPRLILKVKLNTKLPTSNTDGDAAKSKRKHDTEGNGLQNKRRKTQVDSPISPSPSLIEANNSLPRLKTTQQLLMEMKMNQPEVLSIQTPTVNAILQNQIIDESLHEPVKVDYSALHHGRESATNSNVKHLSNTIISPPPSTSSSSTKRSNSLAPSTLSRPTSTSNTWENGCSAAGSPISPSSSSSSSSSWPLPTNIPEPPHSVPLIPKKKRRRKSSSKDLEPSAPSLNLEQSTPLTPDLSTLCSAYQTVAELTEAHCRRVRAEHDARELEARPELLLVPLDQLAFVYERERTRKPSSSPPPPPLPSSTSTSSSSAHPTSKATSLTSIHLLDDDPNRVALPFIDCPLEFDLTLDDLVLQDIPH